jgi:signal transduction histidine kinase
MRDISGSAVSQFSSFLFPRVLAVSEFESPAAVREGLPPTYRMRAEAHYVDLRETRTSETRERSPGALSSPPQGAASDGPRLSDPPTEPEPSRAAASGPTAGWAQQSSRSLDVADPTLHAGRDLAQSLATLSACAELLSGSQSELSRAVVGNLIRAEVWRAASLLQATRLVRQELGMARTAVSVLGVLDRVVQGFLPERRVRPIRFETQSDVPHGSFIAGDEQLLTGAMSCAVLATLAAVDGVQDARIVISAALEPERHVAFAVSQESVMLPQQWHARAFDPNWLDRPGGIPALVWMLAIEQAAQMHGGRVSVDSTGRGTRIAMAVPLRV